MMMPLTAITTFLKTELVFAAFGVLRWPESVTVTTGQARPPQARQVNAVTQLM